MADESRITRRSVLTAGAGGAGALVAGGLLAACSGSSGPNRHTANSAGAHSAPDGAHDTGSSAPKETPSANAGAALATVADIGIGKAVSAELPDGKPALVSRPSSTEVVCFSAICTHQGCTVKPGPTSLDCPCHGSKYDTATGKVLSGPAPRPLPEIAVKVENGKVFTS